MWCCVFCSFENPPYRDGCQACGRVRRIVYPVLIGDLGSLELDSISQIIGREQIATITREKIDTVRPRHVRFYLGNEQKRTQWLLTNLSRSSPVTHNRMKIGHLKYAAIDDGDQVGLGSTKLMVRFPKGKAG